MKNYIKGFGTFINENMESAAASHYSSREWIALKELCQETGGKILSFSDYDGNHEETLNWGNQKTKGSSVGMGLGLEKDGSYTLDVTGNNQELVQMLSRAGLDKFKTDNYGQKTMEIYKIPANQGNFIVSTMQKIIPQIEWN